MTTVELKEQLRQPFTSKTWQDELLPYVFGREQVRWFPVAIELGVEAHYSDRVAAKRQLGVVQLGGSNLFGEATRLAIVEVELQPGVMNIARNRVGLRGLTFGLIDGEQANGVLAFYHDPEQPNYRFSFLTRQSAFDDATGDVISTTTHPKRFTYVLGKQEACTTAAKRLEWLSLQKPTATLEHVREAFSVEKLNKEFFGKYKEYYERFWQFLAQNHREVFLPGVAVPDKSAEKLKQEKPIRDFTKKLLGRLVFLHFLQRKGWLGCPNAASKWEGGDQTFLLSLFERYPDKEHFHSQALTELFFRTLNNPNRENFRFQVGGMRQACKVPYLNGGLFDNDEPAAANLDFPAKYFAELLDFFAQYNFTIDENRPDDHEVGIDPEMLGHIFENLLEENREKNGAFYTPREIVQYMCQESLVEYLCTHLGPEGVTRTDVAALVRQQKVEDKIRTYAGRTDKLLRDVTICDPAIGSGAFPMGMLHEIFTARRYLYPHLNTSAAFDPVAVKKHIIQHTIHGVDLDKGAVDIARLRFWLALVVDEEQPHPLPNLDYKIMQGNSLLESFDGIKLDHLKPDSQDESPVQGQQMGLFQPIGEKEQLQRVALENLLKDYFLVGDAPRKRQLRKQIELLVHEHLHYNVELQLNDARKELNEVEGKLAGVRFDNNDSGAQRTKKETARARQTRAIEKAQITVARLKETEQRLDKLQDSAERPYFLWHLYFHEVFERGGFDVVIGNPPYIQLSKLKEAAPFYASQGYKTFERTGDIYCLFYELARTYLRPGGILAYITSNSWLQTQYGKSLRQLLTHDTDPVALLNFADTQLFDSATVETNILLARHAPCQFSLRAVTIDKEYKVGSSLAQYVETNSFVLTELSEEGWSVSNASAERIKKHMECNGTKIADLPLKIYRGVTTGYNLAFVIDNTTRQRLIQADPKTAGVFKPTLRGRDLKRYSYTQNGYWLINTHNGVKRDGIPAVMVERDYPPLFEYFSAFPDTIKTRFDKGNHWTNLRNCAFLSEFEKPKIIWGELSDSAKFTYDDSAHYIEATLFMMLGKSLKYTLAVLNSIAGGWYFERVTTTSGMGTTRWKKYKIEQLPLPIVSTKKEARIESIVNAVLSGKRDNMDTSELEAEIDALIFSAYKLGEDDIALIMSESNIDYETQKRVFAYFNQIAKSIAL
ncbi:Eco57I restriction-modification methylase domain-containing protein [Hymenobacter actinosclerus]|uniref:site-specific DNA-methyltransferase (adenine-specific) n=1 Tax=Hymenobacter actinosclerus TaxID=82805 RepID=A0A1I0IQH1_9BACT|nr:TaqI-like C-terminal specificity domain-containing protein [Hymenobacter actinosclerus]SET99454.1 Eco57I restriction-modification methylase [Hymenobacter actinosclerus]